MEKANLKNMTANELETFFESIGEPAYRGKQVFRWIRAARVAEFAEMTDLSLALRLKLEEIAQLPKIAAEYEETDEDGTIKLGLRLFDGGVIETVVMPAGDGQYSVCLSSQVGCQLGCAFCYTAKIGFKRSLKLFEITEQLDAALRVIEKKGARLQTVVFMGMGEPLLNAENVLKAAVIFSHKLGLRLPPKKIVISTAGITDAIPALADAPVSPALSLNATTQGAREKIMPIAKKYPLDGLLKAMDALPLKMKQRTLIEYVLLAGVNDGAEDAKRLGKIARRIGGKVNLIPFNQFPDCGFERPGEDKIDEFASALRYEQDATVTVRRSKGQGIYAACGSLAGKARKKS